MKKQKEKLSVKELIQAGGFGAIYLVVYFTLAMLLGFNPITFFVTGPIGAIVLGTVYMLYVSKVPRRGAIFILSIFNLVYNIYWIYIFIIYYSFKMKMIYCRISSCTYFCNNLSSFNYISFFNYF